ncbi:diaminohydroxyphosphoribosylamino-pyrimidine deaminase [Stemphylium lycopersici]|nr:diaminohydroxyphosphoribosylamino-pyrimidine deaminase [Stemphylium lycopersici]
MSLTEILGSEPIVDPEEDAFVVFSQDIPSQSLGFFDDQAATLEFNVAGHDLVIHHSKGLLTSDRKAGTTGAEPHQSRPLQYPYPYPYPHPQHQHQTNTPPTPAIWKVTPLFAAWISSPTNFLFKTSLITPSSTVLELGAGVSGIVALSLGPLVARYIATDQVYVLKLLRQNIAENAATVFGSQQQQSQQGRKGKSSRNGNGNGNAGKKGGGGLGHWESRITALELDWETDAVAHLPHVDLIVSCDCVYNEALVEPLNATCAAICKLRAAAEDNGNGNGGGGGDDAEIRPTLCLIAQQLRSPDVFETWLKSFHEKFWAWQVPGSMLGKELGEGSGFVVYVGVVR